MRNVFVGVDAIRRRIRHGLQLIILLYMSKKFTAHNHGLYPQDLLASQYPGENAKALKG